MPHLSCKKWHLTGSILEPILFSFYISPIAEIISEYGLSQQQYTDDMQLYVTVTKCNPLFNVQKLEQFLSCLHTRFCHNGIALNPEKSNAIIFGTLAAITHSSFSYQYRCCWLHSSCLLGCKNSRCHS